MPSPSTFAVLVGIDRYESRDIAPLSYAASDAQALHDVLQERWGMQAGRRLFLMTDRTDPLPTATNILFRIGKLGPMMDATDTLLFYFSGHGQSLGGMSHLFTFNTDMRDPDALRMTSLSLALLKEKLSRLPCRQVILILDACRSGPLQSRGDSDAALSSAFARDISAVIRFEQSPETTRSPMSAGVVFSCSPGQRSFEPEKLGGGLFSRFLVRTLDSWRGGALPLTDLHRTVAAHMKDFGELHLPNGQEQQPWIECFGPTVPSIPAPATHEAEHNSLASDAVTAQAGATLSHSIIPIEKDDMPRAARVRRSAIVEGNVFGSSIAIEPNVLVRGSLVSRGQIGMSTGAVIEGSVVTSADLVLAGTVNGDVWAATIRVPEPCRIEGRLFAQSDVELPGRSVMRSGVRTSGRLQAGANCMLGAVSAQSVALGDQPQCTYIQATADLVLGVGAQFVVLAAGTALTCASQARGRVALCDGDIEVGDGSEIDWVIADGRVRIGEQCKVGILRARDAIVGPRSTVGRTCVRGALSVACDAELGAAVAEESVVLAGANRIASAVLVCRNGPIEVSGPVTMAGRDLQPSNVFSLSTDGAIGVQRTAGMGAVLCPLMTHELLNLLVSLTGSPLSVK